ncbi:DUF4829 domain-containing protein [Actinomadura hibisca]|uniref:DUF4829 domain-containing protein n=1 Tax=Actinomadura hibisca TaxID=68565 RepID=UPI000831D05F|nr:DUF4829 domain-containing protein [Actinomadura hibisca]
MKIIVRGGVPLLLSASLLAGCGGDGQTHVKLPPAGAPPQEVVTAYVAAINAHDKKTGRALSTAHFGKLETTEVADSLFNDAKLSDLKVSAPIPEQGYESPDGKQYAQVVKVPVTFDLKQKTEVSMPNGPTAWGYLLVRESLTGPWRINDHGNG